MENIQTVTSTFTNHRHSRQVNIMERNSGSRPFNQVLQENLNEEGTPSTATHRRPINTALMNASIEMESLLVGNMLKAMRKTVPKNDWLHGGQAEEIFEDMLYDEYAMTLSRNSNLGIARMIYDQLDTRT